MRCSAFEKLLDSDKDNFSSIDPDIESSHRVDTHAVSVSAAMEATINDDMQTSYRHP